MAPDTMSTVIAGMLPSMMACRPCEVEWNRLAGDECFHDARHEGRPVVTFSAGTARRSRLR